MFPSHDQDWKRGATQISHGAKVSVIGNYYTSTRATNYSTVNLINDGLGSTSNTHLYLEGNYSPDGYKEGSEVVPYLKQTPFASSGITPMAATSIDKTKIGLIAN